MVNMRLTGSKPTEVSNAARMHFSQANFREFLRFCLLFSHHWLFLAWVPPNVSSDNPLQIAQRALIVDISLQSRQDNEGLHMGNQYEPAWKGRHYLWSEDRNFWPHVIVKETRKYDVAIFLFMKYKKWISLVAQQSMLLHRSVRVINLQLFLVVHRWWGSWLVKLPSEPKSVPYMKWCSICIPS